MRTAMTYFLSPVGTVAASSSSHTQASSSSTVSAIIAKLSTDQQASKDASRAWHLPAAYSKLYSAMANEFPAKLQGLSAGFVNNNNNRIAGNNVNMDAIQSAVAFNPRKETFLKDGCMQCYLRDSAAEDCFAVCFPDKQQTVVPSSGLLFNMGYFQTWEMMQ